MAKMIKDKILTTDGHLISIILETSTDLTDTVIIFVHGIFTDKHENGRFDRLSSHITTIGIDVLRFDLRGHGESNLSSINFNIKSALDDLSAIFKNLIDLGYRNIHLLGSSFGGSIILLYMSMKYKDRVPSITLLNPVINYKNVISANEIFTKHIIKELFSNGSTTLHNNFEISKVLYSQLNVLKPYEHIEKINSPIKIFHDKNDEIVPCSDSKCYFSSPNCELDILHSSGHAFKSKEAEGYVFKKTIEWLQNYH